MRDDDSLILENLYVSYIGENNQNYSPEEDEKEREAHQKEWDKLKDYWHDKENIIIEPYVRLRKYGGHVRPNSIFVPKEKRKQGLGTKVMNSMIELADSQNRPMALSPSTDFGATSTERLKKFYSRFGFVRNKGRNKDFTVSQTMYRNNPKLK